MGFHHFKDAVNSCCLNINTKTQADVSDTPKFINSSTFLPPYLDRACLQRQSNASDVCLALAAPAPLLLFTSPHHKLIITFCVMLYFCLCLTCFVDLPHVAQTVSWLFVKLK